MSTHERWLEELWDEEDRLAAAAEELEATEERKAAERKATEERKAPDAKTAIPLPRYKLLTARARLLVPLPRHNNLKVPTGLHTRSRAPGPTPVRAGCGLSSNLNPNLRCRVDVWMT